jgi:hypothetical protein
MQDQAPGSKLQAPEKVQVPSSTAKRAAGAVSGLDLGSLGLGLFWSLGLDLGASQTRLHPAANAEESLHEPFREVVGRDRRARRRERPAWQSGPTRFLVPRCAARGVPA